MHEEPKRTIELDSTCPSRGQATSNEVEGRKESEIHVPVRLRLDDDWKRRVHRAYR